MSDDPSSLSQVPSENDVFVVPDEDRELMISPVDINEHSSLLGLIQNEMNENGRTGGQMLIMDQEPAIPYPEKLEDSMVKDDERVVNISHDHLRLSKVNWGNELDSDPPT